jgi:hypothetical protein
VNSIDLEAYFRGVIDSALTVATWADDVVRLLRLDGLSQIWSQQPAWYFWVRGAPGPYHLQLETTAGQAVSTDNLGRKGLFSLRCYPYPRSGGFGLLSAEEQRLIESDIFDETNTPRFEHLDEIPYHLFQLAAIEYLVGPDESWELIAMESLRAEPMGISGQQPPGRQSFATLHKTVDEACLAPTMQVCDPFFEMFVGLLCYSTKHEPLRLAVQAWDGFGEPSEKLGKGQCMAVDDGRLFTRLVILSNGAGKELPEANAIIDSELEREGAVTAYDERFAHCCCGHTHGQTEHRLRVNELWWTLAKEKFASSVTSTCGCK